jgi:hypothetical protein
MAGKEKATASNIATRGSLRISFEIRMKREVVNKKTKSKTI